MIERPPPMLYNLPLAEEGVRLLGFAGVRCLAYASAAGFVGLYRDLGVEDIIELDPQQRSHCIEEHLHSEVLSADLAATHLAREERVVLASTDEALLEYLRDRRQFHLKLGRGSWFVLRRPVGAQPTADEAAFNHRGLKEYVCTRDSECDGTHLWIGYQQREQTLLWHFNMRRGVVVPPRPLQAEVR